MSRMTDYCDVACDQCGQWEATGQTKMRHARAELKARGWRRRGHGDLCPECAGTRKRLLTIGEVMEAPDVTDKFEG